LSKVICSAIVGDEVERRSISHVLQDLIGLEARPAYLTETAFDWCSMIYESRESLADWKGLLLACLEIGFRHLDPKDQATAYRLTHTDRHPEMADVVFGSQNSEAVADLLHAWIIGDSLEATRDIWIERLICLHNSVPFSPRLRRLVIRSAELIDCEGFEAVGLERFLGLLDLLHVTVEDMEKPLRWLGHLLYTLKTLNGAQHLSHWYWELLAELVISLPPWWIGWVRYNPHIVTFLAEAQEWSKLECCMGIVCILRPPEANGITEEDLGRSISLLFRKRPGAFEKLKQWMEQWSQKNNESIPESFQRICEQAQETVQQDIP